MDRKVYTCFCTAVIHKGHLNIISEARKLGEVTVGVLSDEAMIRYNRFTTSDYVWQWKGGTYNGRNFDAYKNIYAIPASQLSTYGNEQNPGY